MESTDWSWLKCCLRLRSGQGVIVPYWIKTENIKVLGLIFRGGVSGLPFQLLKKSLASSEVNDQVGICPAGQFLLFLLITDIRQPTILDRIFVLSKFNQ